jgi:hypothetical protein
MFAAQSLILTQSPWPVKALIGDNAGNFTPGSTGCQGICQKPLLRHSSVEFESPSNASCSDRKEELPRRNN